MKIAYSGIALPEGKVRYEDPVVRSLEAKFAPKKVTPYYFEFIGDNFASADIIVLSRDHILDLLIYDMEKMETRLERSEDAEERQVLSKVLAGLEEGIPVCDMELGEVEASCMRQTGPLSLKPVLIVDSGSVDVQTLIPLALEKAGMIFFYTAGQQEVHAWLVGKGFNARDCAGKIHTDLARGFIKAEIIPVNDMLLCHSMNDARKRGLSRLVDRDFIIPSETVMEIRFNI
jgi:ribosome-binding ATPase YchF (GTP1/OBG family)